jgi:dTDP-3-amino-2,3,6-trideoxy-4-keto-D-glucose/dTDP-3-amino-3,4,6-trideoxy-alpha-D-glucose/dTDP-2,6-dideoxy-D-kanosamine transaminase
VNNVKLPMKIPMQDLARSVASEPYLFDTLSRVLRSGYWLGGPETNAFAIEFAKYLGVPHFLCVANGTDALEIALRAVGCERGDEVMTVANAGGYTTAICQIIGAIPVYIDIDRDTFLMDISSVPKALGKRTKAVVTTHLYGGLVDVEALRGILDSAGCEGVAIIEDCAQAHGATMRERKAGSFGDMAAFSFYPTKNLGALGDAGGIATCDTDLIERAELLHQYGWRPKYHVETGFGRNSRMDEIQAAVLRSRLLRLDGQNERRRSIIRAYERAGRKHLRFPRLNSQIPSGHLAVACVADRDRFRHYLASCQIATDVHYPMLDCDQPPWRNLGRNSESLIKSREIASMIVSLPCFPEMTDAEVDHVCKTISLYTVE